MLRPPHFDKESGQARDGGQLVRLSDGASWHARHAWSAAKALGIRRSSSPGFAVAGCEPDEWGSAGLRVPKLLKRCGLRIATSSLELNEAFASQVVTAATGSVSTRRSSTEGGSISTATVRHDRLAHGRHDRNECCARRPATARDHVHRRGPGAAALPRRVTVLRASPVSRRAARRAPRRIGERRRAPPARALGIVGGAGDHPS